MHVMRSRTLALYTFNENTVALLLVKNNKKIILKVNINLQKHRLLLKTKEQLA